MNFEDIEKVLLHFGWRDYTKEWYEPWKIQKVFRFKNMYYLILDPPSIELVKNTQVIDTSLGLTEEQLTGLLAFLSLSYNERNTLKYKQLLHLDLLYPGIKEFMDDSDPKAFHRFAKEFESIDLKTFSVEIHS